MCGDGNHFTCQAVESVGTIALVMPVAEFFSGDQVNGNMLFQQGDVGVRDNLGSQCFLHGMSCCIGGVNDAPVAVTAFACQMIAGIGAGIS